MSEFKTATDKTKTSVDNTTKSVGGANGAWGAYSQAVYNAQKSKYDGSNATGGLSNVSWWADNATWKIGNVSDALASLGRTMVGSSLSGMNVLLNVYGKAKGGYVGGYADGGIIPAYAAGGVNSADLFMANENGNPELVGRIGSRTAVANQGQMVEALAQGLERIFSDGMNGSSNVEVVVNMDGVAVARAADRGNKSLNRRFNVQLA